MAQQVQAKDKDGLQKMDSGESARTYTADWESLDSHPLPDWFDHDKYGMFIHWGPYSSDKCEILEHMNPDCLTAENYDPEAWAQLALDAGMKYAILTCKHGGGFAMYNTSFGLWNSVKSGPKRDLFGEFVQACRKVGLRVFAYYCKVDIFMPAEHFLEGKSQVTDEERFKQIVRDYDMQSACDNWPAYMQGQIKEICEQYEPDGIWFDGVVPSYHYSGMNEVYAWIYNRYPDMILNDRVGCFSERKCHGDFYTYERPWIKPVHILPHKWQAERHLAGKWTYDPALTEDDIESAQEIAWDMVDTIALGGNHCVNIAPRADGSVPEYYRKRLLEVGTWIETNASAIYGTQPWSWGYCREGDDIRYVMNSANDTVFAFIKECGVGALDLHYMHSSVCVPTKVELIGYGELEWCWGLTGSVQVEMPDDVAQSEVNIQVLQMPIVRETDTVGIKRDGG